jgi:SAM-dependent methyltransferase
MTVIVVAIAARMIVFPLPPTLSDDGYRYVWDGQVQLQGFNPYQYRPSEFVATDAVDQALYERLNSPQYYSVYPPASQVVFVSATAIARGDPRLAWYYIKACLVLLEGIGLLALSRLTGPAAMALYAWHPLPIIEIAGQGHTEGGMVGLMLMAAWALQHRRFVLTGAALALAGWFKLLPFALLAFTLKPAPTRVLAGAVVATIALAMPYAAPSVLINVSESLLLYVRLFEWNAGPYLALKGAAAALTGGGWSTVLGPALAGAFALGLGLLLLLHHKNPWWPPHVWFIALGLFLTTTTTVHPWYLLGVLCLLPLVAHAATPGRLHTAAWHVLAAGSLGTYLFYSHGVAAYWTAVALGWGGWALALMAASVVATIPGLMQRRARFKWEWIEPHAGNPGRLLDLGAGEGYVGREAATDGWKVELADVIDFNRTELPLTVIAEPTLPWADGTFDSTILVFVLHHARDPRSVLREAERVTAGRVVVVESVAQSHWDRRWLPFADRLANRVRSGGAMTEQEDHLCFRSAEEWRQLFTEAGLRVVGEDRRGGWWHRRNLFVLRRA